MANGRLVGKVVLVTGSSTGIGEGIARMAAREGAAVIIHGFEPDLGPAVVASIEADGGTATFARGDLMDPDVPAQIVRHAVEAFGRLDALVNNAGISTRAGLEDTTPELFDRVFAINTRAPVFFIRAALPYLREAGAGRIVNIGSVNAWSGGQSLLAYSMSKGAMMTMTRNLSAALAPDGIRVNQLNIGWTLTPNEHQLQLSEGKPEDWPETVAQNWMPFKRLFRPDDIANMVIFLLSEAGELISGSVISLDQKNHIGDR